MKMLLQQAGSGLYFKSRGTWTEITSEALVMDNWLSAYDFVVFNRLRDTFIVPVLEETGPSFHKTEGLRMSELDFK